MMDSIEQLRKALGTNIRFNAVVTRVESSQMWLSTPRGLVKSQRISSLKIGDRVIIEGGVITPLNTGSTPVFNL